MDDLKQLQVDSAKLMTARKESGLSMSEAARRVGVSRQYLWNIENGVQRPGADVLVRLCALLGKDIADVTSELLAEPQAATI